MRIGLGARHGVVGPLGTARRRHEHLRAALRLGVAVGCVCFGLGWLSEVCVSAVCVSAVSCAWCVCRCVSVLACVLSRC